MERMVPVRTECVPYACACPHRQRQGASPPVLCPRQPRGASRGFFSFSCLRAFVIYIFAPKFVD